MSDPSQTISVTGVSHGGGVDSGRGVYFDAKTEDGSVVRVVLRHTHVSAFIAMMMAFAGEAKKDRDDSGVDGENPLEYTDMLACQSIQIAPLADLSGVAIQFLIQPGVTLVFPLETRFIPQLAGSLMKWHAGLDAHASDGAH